MTVISMTESRHRRRVDPLIESGLEGIQDLVKTLNRTRILRTIKGETSYIELPFSEQQLALRQLIERWMKSGPNLRALMLDDQELAESIRYGNTILWPATNGRGYLDWAPHTPESHLSTDKFEHSSPKDQALRSFVRLITNPDWERLGGPCKRCSRYFLSDSSRRRVFCSRTCGSASTAISAIVKKRTKAKNAKVKLAIEHIKEWEKLKTNRFTWQQWLLRDPAFTKKWITRAVNAALIKCPTVDRAIQERVK